MTNHMKEIAKMLGVELNDKFKIICPNNNVNTIAMLTNHGLVINCEPNTNPITSNQVLGWLLTGNATIERVPWEPTYNEHYFSVGPGGVIEPGVWLNDFVDRALYKLGNCYRYGSDAELDIDKWIAFYASDEVLEV